MDGWIRKKTLGLLSFMPPAMGDGLFLRLKYRVLTGERLHLRHPRTFNEKLQWLKVHDRRDVCTTMVDKAAAKDWVAAIIGEEHIIPTLGVWESPGDIDFDSLPERFVLKCTHDSGGLAICRDRAVFDTEAAAAALSASLATDYWRREREWPYRNVPRRIIAEEYMDDGTGGLTDYKFYCFGGKPEYLYVSSGLENHRTARISFLTMDWEFAPFGRSDFRPFEELPAKPEHFDEMVSMARKLSQGHPFLRVDLYEIGGRVYFSELTFFPCSGYMPFVPPEWDRKLGDLLKLPAGDLR